MPDTRKLAYDIGEVESPSFSEITIKIHEMLRKYPEIERDAALLVDLVERERAKHEGIRTLLFAVANQM